MKICLACSHGGHLTEMLRLMDAFEGHDVFFMTYRHARTEALPYKKYLMRNISQNPVSLAASFPRILLILAMEKPDLIISTGDEIAIPALAIGRILGIKTIYIESWCKVKTSSGTGRVVYHLADEFLVQWPELASVYGDKARYEGAVI